MPEKMGKPASKAGAPSFDFDAGHFRNVIRPDMVSDWTAGSNSFFNQMKFFEIFFIKIVFGLWTWIVMWHPHGTTWLSSALILLGKKKQSRVWCVWVYGCVLGPC